MQFSVGYILSTECQPKELAMRKYISTLFLAVGLFLYAITASEAKTPAYCETTQILQTERHKIITSKNEKFRMTVSNDFVDFGINGFTGGTNSFKISRFEKLTDWQADYDRFYISFLDGNFYFAAVFPHSSLAVSAKCKIY
ncbi:MAG: hypothetical protein ACPIB4_02850 [Candidatus Puniceispirillaceae bacterium]